MIEQITIVARFKFQFDVAMKMAFTPDYELKREKPAGIVGCLKEGDSLFLFQYKPTKPPEGFIAFPVFMGVNTAIEFLWDFITATEPIEGSPDTDGSVEKGFKVTTEGASWQGKYYESFLIVKPEWIVYGK